MSGPVALDQPSALRAEIRAGRFTGLTTGVAAGYMQANLAVLPQKYAGDFRKFCERNPRPCPLLEVTEAGSAEPVAMAPGADLRTDLPRYRVFRNGAFEAETTDARPFWRDDMVAFLLGCSFTFEAALLREGIPIRHLQAGRNVPMYRTDMSCRSAGAFHGPMVVSMRPIPQHLVDRAAEVTARFPESHGAPIHIGDPRAIGIQRLLQPDWGDPPQIESGDVAVFWACGVTPQAAALASKVELMITHAPGHMFVTDRRCHPERSEGSVV